MERLELLNHLESNDLKNIYLIHGSETYLIDEVFKKFKTLLNPDMIDFNLSIIDGKETSLQEFSTSVETVPFLDDRRFTIIKDFELISGKKKNFDESDEKIILEMLNDIPDSTVLVFLNYGGIDKKRKIYKTISKNGIVCELNKLEDFALYDLVKNEFIRRNAKINNSEITFFIEVCGYRDRTSEITISDILKEIDKLVSYAQEEVITKDIIKNLSTSKIENDIFKLVDMIGSKNPKKAYKILEDMIESGESVLGIFAMLYRQFNNIIKLKTLQEDKLGKSDIMNRMEIKPYVLNILSKQARFYNEESLISIINYLSDYDYKIKNGLIKDSLAVEIFIAKYCS